MQRKKPAPSEPSAGGLGRDLYDWLQLLAFVLAVVVLVFTFLVQVVGVSGSSMYPTLHDRDIMLVQRVGYTPHSGDIVVLRKESFLEEAVVKRVIATAGQEVEIDYNANVVYVDGVALDEPYINQQDPDPMVERTGMVNSSFIVPQGCIFVMGDNRNASTDSRYAALGMVDTRYVLGRALCVLFPFSDAQTLN